MRFRIEFDIDNAAFDHEERDGAIALVLRMQADAIEHDGAGFRCVLDVNGNRIGQCALIADEDEESDEAA